MKLTIGRYRILIDEADYPLIKDYSWTVWKHGKRFYVRTGKGSLMHRLILGLEPGDGKEVDHANRNGLDNRRCNIRICSRSQNLCNRKCKAAYKVGKKWRAIININGIDKHLGYFNFKKDAVCAFKKAAAERRLTWGYN